MNTYRPFLIQMVLCIFILGLSNHISNAEPSDSNDASEIVFILDASGSMWGQIDGENKISIAKTVLKGLVDGLPDNTEVGLIAYGHREKGDCKDIETVVEPGPLNKSAINKKIDELNPKGKTPITDSVLMAFDLVKANENATTVVLVSDGIETCGGDPCQAVKDAKESGINFIMHVVGFDVGDVDVSELECAAQAGGGLYMSAQNAGELSEALETAVEMPAELPMGKLSVKVTAEGKLQDSMLILTNTESGEELKGQRTYSDEKTNPRIISIPDGTYNLEVKPLGMKGVQSKTLSGLEIKEGEVVEKEVNFGYGELSIKVVRNGKLSDASVKVYKVNTEDIAAQSRTYTSENSNPKLFKLEPGIYDVEVTALEIKSKPSKKLSEVEILSGETIENTIDFSSGTLKIGAFQGEKFVDAVVRIKNSETDEQITQGRTYTSSNSNPKTFELTPGTYNVEVSALGIVGKPTQTFDAIEIVSSETVEKTAQFSSGELKVGAFEGEKFVDASVSVIDSKTGEKIKQSRTYKSSGSNPKAFELSPGIYDIEVKSLVIQGHPVVKFESVEVKPGETIEETAQFSSGVIKIGAKEGEAFTDSMVSITNSRTGEKITAGRTYADYKEFILIPDSYTVTVKAFKIEGNPEKTVEVELKALETAEVNIDFTK